MATEIPVRLIGSNVVRNWPASMDTASFSGNQRFTAPSRSGSAPPSMEGSSLAIRDLGGQQNAELNAILENLNIGFERRQSEEQLRADPAYVAYYHSNVNLNPRIPPPLVSQENRRLAHHIGDNWRIPSLDDGNKRYLPASRLILSTHAEEHEDDRSPGSEFSNDTALNTSGTASGQSTSPLPGCYKSIVDLIQEDFPRTPSPVYNSQPRTPSLLEQTQTTDADACDNLLDEFMNTKVNSIPSVTKRHSDLSAVSNVSSNIPSSLDKCRLQPSQMDLNTENRIEAGSSTRNMINDLKSLKLSNDVHRNHAPRQNHHQSSLQSGSSIPVHLGQSQMTNQASQSPNYSDHYLHSQSKLSSMEVRPVLPSAGIVPPLYATAAAFAAPYYPNLQPSNLLPPQFGIGGVTVNASLLPPFFSGYPYNAIQIPYENSTGSNYNVRASGAFSRGNVIPGYYGQIGVATQHSYSDPLYMSYFQHPSAHAYSSLGQFDPTAPRGSAVGSLPVFDAQKGSLPFAYSSDQSPQVLRSGVANSPSIRKGGAANINFYGNSANLSSLMQYPSSPLTSPLYPGSPAANSVTPGRRGESNRSPGSSVRAGGTYTGWQSPRLQDKIDDSKLHSFLEELKSSKSRRYELSDIAGRIVEFSADQHGSRFIQQKLESCSIEEKASVFQEVLPHASTLMSDVFGNYVIQKFFEHGSPEERKELANQLVGHVLSLSLQMYGCRVIQKALEVIELDQKTELVYELDGHVLRCVRDQNGNHVIQKCIECVPTERIGFMISAFRGHVASLSMHPYGCRVIQRVLEHCTDELQSSCIVDEILHSACILAQDQYGNYVTQHVLERGKPLERSQIINKVSGQVVQMSQHKFASNVVEKCLEYGSSTERERLIMEIIGQTEGNDNLLIMMKDQFANYVVQKILDVCTDKQKGLLLSCVRSHSQALKKYTYGKHIVARVEQLSGDGEESPSSDF
ncbi:pumilio homolog 5 [Phalaenopsis equestris]|uniref:pumilio homolog 5 n=1 Tax=Phalaenopsis equestris TaxID=78828 RepID=UPI0009E191F8|nr:pumilio homolog 5 [Phalaenopsis equestris]XP_020581800.1 pumilio homolog 5 [Phalaenopsis equestris]